MLKRKFSVILALALGLILGSIGSVFAAATYEGLPAVNVQLDGKPIKADVPAVILAGRTLLPVRAIAEAVGLDVKWDQATQTVTLTSKMVDSGNMAHSEGLVYADTFVHIDNPMPSKDSMGMTEMMLDVTNIYSAAVSGTVQITYYDHNGMPIGSGSGKVTNLAPGAKVEVNLMSEKSVEGYAHYKVTSDIMSHH